MDQEKKEKLGFFKRLYLAITDFRIYPYTQREKTSKARGYFLKLIVVISIIITVFIMNNLIGFAEFILDNYSEAVPEFYIDDGKLYVEEILNEKTSDYVIYVNTNYTYSEALESGEYEDFADYKNKLIITSDKISVINEDNYSSMDFSEVPNNQISKTIVYTEMQNFMNDWVNILYISLFVFVLVLIAYIIIKFINVLILIFATWVLNSIFRLELKFSDYFKIVAYSITLPIIIETVVICSLGYVPEYAYYAYHLLSYVYIFYALRAIKLDNIIMNNPGINLREKAEEVIEKLSEEVEREAKKEVKEEKKEEENKKEDEEK